MAQGLATLHEFKPYRHVATPWTSTPFVPDEIAIAANDDRLWGYRSYDPAATLISGDEVFVGAQALDYQVELSLAAQSLAMVELDAGWDGYGADPIDWSTVRDVIVDVREALWVSGARAPDLVPGADGSLQAEWHLPKLQLTYRIADDGSRHTWVRQRETGQEHEYFGNDARRALLSWAPLLA